MKNFKGHFTTLSQNQLKIKLSQKFQLLLEELWYHRE